MGADRRAGQGFTDVMGWNFLPRYMCCLLHDYTASPPDSGAAEKLSYCEQVSHNMNK